MDQHVDVRRTGSTLHLTLNRPDKKNALTFDMYRALADAIEAVDGDETVRAILLSGAGGSFSAGNDAGDFLEYDSVEEPSPPMRFLRALAKAETPVVAAVQGVAVGIGTTMLLHCDLVYAAEDARFHLPFVNLGLVPEAASSFLLPRLMGHQRAAPLLLLGVPFSAQQSLAAGIVSAIAPTDNVLAAANEACVALAGLPPEALRLTKRLMKRPVRDAIAEAMDAEVEVFRDRLTSAEVKEAMRAFLEKRPRRAAAQETDA